MAVPVLLLIYGNLFKVNCTFPLYPSEHVAGVVSPLAVGLSGLGILSDCVSITLCDISKWGRQILQRQQGKYGE